MIDIVIPGWLITHALAFLAGGGLLLVIGWSLRSGQAEGD